MCRPHLSDTMLVCAYVFAMCSFGDRPDKPSLCWQHLIGEELLSLRSIWQCTYAYTYMCRVHLQVWYNRWHEFQVWESCYCFVTLANWGCQRLLAPGMLQIAPAAEDQFGWRRSVAVSSAKLLWKYSLRSMYGCISVVRTHVYIAFNCTIAESCTRETTKQIRFSHVSFWYSRMQIGSGRQDVSMICWHQIVEYTHICVGNVESRVVSDSVSYQGLVNSKHINWISFQTQV